MNCCFSEMKVIVGIRSLAGTRKCGIAGLK